MKNIKKIIASAAAALMLTATLATTASAEEYYTYQNNDTPLEITLNSSTERCSIWDDFGDFLSDVTNPSPEDVTNPSPEEVGVLLALA